MYLSLLSVSVNVNKCDHNLLVDIKVLNFKIKFSGNFLNSVKFMNFIFFSSPKNPDSRSTEPTKLAIHATIDVPRMTVSTGLEPPQLQSPNRSRLLQTDPRDVY